MRLLNFPTHAPPPTAAPSSKIENKNHIFDFLEGLRNRVTFCDNRGEGNEKSEAIVLDLIPVADEFSFPLVSRSALG